jgi:hypothetical protein
LQEAFDIEYWLLEEAKLQRMPKEQPLSRKMAFVTGGAGGIGKAIADKLGQRWCLCIYYRHQSGKFGYSLGTYNGDTGSGL